MNKTKRVKAFSEIEANDFVLSLEETGYKRQKRTGNKISNFVEKIVREEERKEEEVKYNLPSEIWCEIFSYFSELDLCSATLVCRKWNELLCAVPPECWHTFSLNCCKKVQSEIPGLVNATRLPRFRALKSLNLFCMHDVDDGAIKTMFFRHRNLSSLEQLTFTNNNQLTRKGYMSLFRSLSASSSRSLTKLNLYGCHSLTPASLKYLSKYCPQLQSLDLEKCKKISDESVRSVAENCRQLTRIDLSVCEKLTDKALEYLSALCPNLRVVGLYKCRMSHHGVEMLVTHCKKIEELELGKCQGINNHTVRAIAVNLGQNLKVLKAAICGHRITDKSMQSLSAYCQELVHLDITCACVTNKGLAFLGQGCRKLEVLDICGTLVTDEGVKLLVSHCHQISSLQIGWTNITDRSLYEISLNSPKLKALLLDDCEDITDRGVDVLIRGCTQLETLSFRHNKISERSVHLLHEKCITLKRLSIECCENISQNPAHILRLDKDDKKGEDRVADVEDSRNMNEEEMKQEDKMKEEVEEEDEIDGETRERMEIVKGKGNEETGKEKEKEKEEIAGMERNKQPQVQQQPPVEFRWRGVCEACHDLDHHADRMHG